jgi:long-chain fatty acid transport protein
MSKKNTRKLVRNLVALAVAAGPMSAAMATNGYFSHGYGMKAKGMGGAAVASTDNAFAGANNPAAAAWAGNRMELGVDLFMPTREMTRTGSGLNASVSSDSNLFLVPEFGYNRAISDKLGVGITVYGNGGMNTDYAGGQVNCGYGPANVLCGSGRLGVDLMQLIIAPTVALKVSEHHSLGISPLLVKQIFKADGLQMFQGMSSAPTSVSGYGYDGSQGVGVRLGYLGKINDQLTLGASYAPKVKMSKFANYAGLFAEAGGFDIPENYTVGMSYQASPSVNVALDYQHIGYSGVASIANPSSNALIAPLGAANGAGFGWSDVNAWKLGVQWQVSSALTLRAGFNVGDNPVQSRDVSFNILAPGVVTTHYTVGGTYAMSPTTEVTMSYMYAPSNSVSGSSLFNSLMGPGAGGTETIKMSQQALGFQFGWKW